MPRAPSGGATGGAPNLNEPPPMSRTTKDLIKENSQQQQQRRSPRHRQDDDEDSRDRISRGNGGGNGNGRPRMYSNSNTRHLIDRPYNNYSGLNGGGRGGYRRKPFSNGRRQEDSLADRLAPPTDLPYHQHPSTSRGRYRLRSQSLNHHRNFQPHQRPNANVHSRYNPRRNRPGRNQDKRRRLRGAKSGSVSLPAPVNTNEFLMAECKSPNYELIMEQINKNHSRGGDGAAEPPADLDDDEEYYSSPDDEQDFMSQQFSETYNNIQAEHLNSLTKSDLVREYISLKGHVDDLTQQLRATPIASTSSNQPAGPMSGRGGDSDVVMAPDSSHDVPDEKLQETDGNNGGSSPMATVPSKEEIRRLFEENRRLKRENMLLRNQPTSSAVAASSGD